MTPLDAATIRQSLAAADSLDCIEVFARIDSTNTYLKDQPSPPPGQFRVAIADHQTSGRGRQDRRWVSQPGKSLCLSLSYSFQSAPPDLSALTLALGVRVASTLTDFGADGIEVKWPNDILIGQNKLAGILTESQLRGNDSVTVIIGIGVNLSLPDTLETEDISDWASTATDLQAVLDKPPTRQELSGQLIDALFKACRDFEFGGFAAFADQFRRFDALKGRTVTLDTPEGRIQGAASGVDVHGALQIETDEGVRNIFSGSVVDIGEAVARE